MINAQTVLLCLLGAVISYIIGSISFAIIFSKLFIKKDVRQFGSGNAGMTNVVRTAGVLPGILTLLCDFLKGAVAVGIGKYLIFDYLYTSTGIEILKPAYGAFYCGIFCILGHIFPVFFGLKGGKGVATTVGIMLIIDWKTLVVALSIFLVIFLTTKIVSVGSIIAAFSLPFSTYLFYSEKIGTNKIIIVGLSAILGGILIAKHKDNIVRILKGEEKKITSKRSEHDG